MPTISRRIWWRSVTRLHRRWQHESVWETLSRTLSVRLAPVAQCSHRNKGMIPPRGSQGLSQAWSCLIPSEWVTKDAPSLIKFVCKKWSHAQASLSSSLLRPKKTTGARNTWRKTWSVVRESSLWQHRQSMDWEIHFSSRWLKTEIFGMACSPSRWNQTHWSFIGISWSPITFGLRRIFTIGPHLLLKSHGEILFCPMLLRISRLASRVQSLQFTLKKINLEHSSRPSRILLLN